MLYRVKEFNSVRNSGVLLTNVQNNQSTVQYRSFAETQKISQSTINMKQCKSTLSLLEKYSSSIEKTNKLNTYCKDEFKKYQQRTKQSKVWSSHVKSSVVVPSQVKIANPKPTQFYELKHPNVIEVDDESKDEIEEESFEHISAAFMVKSRFEIS